MRKRRYQNYREKPSDGSICMHVCMHMCMYECECIRMYVWIFLTSRPCTDTRRSHIGGYREESGYLTGFLDRRQVPIWSLSSTGPVDTRYPTYMQRIQTKSITIYVIGVCSFLICEIACVCAVAIHSSQLVNLFIRTNTPITLHDTFMS
jgi:hypothetical protein